MGSGRRAETAITVATLPVALLVLMGKRYYFDAPLFVVGVALVVGAAVTLLVAAFSTPRDRVGSPMLAHQTSNQAMQRTAPRSDV